MINEIAMCFIERFNEMIDSKIPKENRNEKRLDLIRNFGITCFKAGFEVGFDAGHEVSYDVIEHTEQENEELTVS